MNPALFAALDEYPSLGESFSFLLLGILTVLTTLTVLAMVCSLLGKIFLSIGKKDNVKRHHAAIVAAAVAAMHDSDEHSRIVAVITAAVAHTLQQPFEIVSIKTTEVRMPAMQGSWSLEGRRQIFTSHKIR